MWKARSPTGSNVAIKVPVATSEIKNPKGAKFSTFRNWANARALYEVRFLNKFQEWSIIKPLCEQALADELRHLPCGDDLALHADVGNSGNDMT